MLDLWNTVSLAVFDTLLGWMLVLPSDLALVVLALLTAGLMVLIRPWTTNQDMLARVARDNLRLKELKRAAKKQLDREAPLRYRATSNVLSMRKLAAEGKPLALVIVPVAMLATWAMSRLEFHPPAENETVELVAYLSTVGEVIHIVPQPPDLESTNGWVQQVEIQPNEPSAWDKLLVRLHLTEERTPEPDAVARWKLKGKARAEPYKLLLRFRDSTSERELIIGQTIYAPVVEVDDKDPGITTHTMLRPVRFLGIPGLGEWCPGWLVGYIIIVVPLVFFLKWVLNIY